MPVLARDDTALESVLALQKSGGDKLGFCEYQVGIYT